MVHKFYIGIDVSLKKFDVSLFCEDKKSPHAVFENTPKVLASFLQWCRKHAGMPKNLHIVMEATNVYWEDLAHFCHQKGATVSVVNPRLSKGYAKATGLRSKTDKLDAALIAHYAAKEQPAAWEPPPPLFRKLLLRVRQSEHLKTLLAAERTRSKMLRDGDALESNARLIVFLKDEIRGITREIEVFIKDNHELNKSAQLLASIPMLGKASLPWVLARLLDGQTITQREAYDRLSTVNIARTIFDLRRYGWPVITTPEESPTRDGRIAHPRRENRPLCALFPRLGRHRQVCRPAIYPGCLCR